MMRMQHQRQLSLWRTPLLTRLLPLLQPRPLHLLIIMQRITQILAMTRR